MSKNELELEALSWLIPIAKDFSEREDEDFIKWLETFKGKSECIDFLKFIDSGLYKIVWNADPNEPIEENPNVTHRDVMEALCYTAIEKAKEHLASISS